MPKERILFLDTARVVAMLWIVGFWHLRHYTGIGFSDNIVTFIGDDYITDIMLSVFMFLSGFFMSKYRFDDFWNDCKAFYWKRFTRFYLLYATSAILLYGIGFNRGIFRLITTLTLTSTFILPQPQTLWFFSMLASFYVFTPFILKSPCKSLIINGLIVLSGGVILHLLLPKGIDTRFFWCFPLYTFGIYVGKRNEIMRWMTNDLVGVLSVISLVLFFILLLNYSIVSDYLWFFILPLGIISVIYLSKYISMLPIKSLIGVIAYASMCAYLFHREFYSILKRICVMSGITYSYWFCIIFFLPVCLFGSYFLQKYYDRYIVGKLLISKKESNGN